ncbi:MAG: glycosyltransferase, partial [Actinobacteria bacterium]|nr:glycosyltransferase [Actinomycetota bacterium]
AVVDGVTGLLVAPDNPAMLAQRVRGLLAMPVQLEALGIAAADRARSRYSMDRIGRETAEAYEWCLRRRSGVAPEVAAEEEADDDYGVAGLLRAAALG